MNDELALRIWTELKNISSHMGDIAHNTSRIASTLETYEENHDLDYTSNIHDDMKDVVKALNLIASVQDERL